MKQKLWLNNVLFTCIALTLMIFSVMLWLSYREKKQEKTTAALIAQSQETLYQFTKLLTYVTDNETGSRGFLLTGNQIFLEPLINSRKNIYNQISVLRSLNKGNSNRQTLIDSLQHYSEKRMNFSDSTIKLREEKGLDAATILVATGRGKFYLDNVREKIMQLTADENRFLAEQLKKNALEAEQEQVKFLSVAFIVVILLMLLIWSEKKRIEDRAERKSRDELELLSLQIDNANDAIYTLDANRKIKSWNSGAEKLYGFTRAEAMGMESNTLLHTVISNDDLLRILIELDESLYWTGELERKKKNGDTVYVTASTTCVKNNEGIITGYVSVSRDITAQRKLNEELNHLANIVEQSSEGIFSRGTDQRIISWNHGAEQLFGFNRAEVMGKTISELGILTLSAEEINLTQHAIIENGNWSSEKVFRCKNGTSFFGSVTANSIQNQKGEIVSFNFIVKDISRRKELEDELRSINLDLEKKVEERTKAVVENEKKYRYLFENNPLPMWVIDAGTSKFLDVNETALHHYGYSREEFLSRTAVEILPADEVDAFMKISSSLSDQQIKNTGVWTHIKKDGTRIEVEINSHVIMLENRRAVLVLINDITEKNKAETKLVASEKRFRALVENNYDTIALMDESYNVIYRSPSADRVIGFTPEQKEAFDAMENVHPEDRAHAVSVMEQARLNPGKPIKALVRHWHSNQHYVWMEGVVTNLLHDENVHGYVANFRDVTDRVEAEEKITISEKRFRALLENNNDIISLMDASFTVTYRSPSATRITGWTDEEIKDFPMNKIIHPDDLEDAARMGQELITCPGKPVKTLFRSLHKQGHYLWMEGIVTNLLHDPTIKAIVFNFRDVTERIENEKKLASSELRFRSLIENSAEGISLLDEASNVIYRSPSGYKMLGNNPTINSLSLAAPEDIVLFREKFNESLSKPEQPVGYKVKYRHASGRFLWAEGVFTNLLHLDGVNAVVANYHEVTDRVEAENKLISSESRFRSLIENISDAIVLNDKDFKILYQSPSVTKILGYTLEERKHTRVIDYLHPGDRDEFLNVYKKLDIYPNTPVSFQYRVRHKNGEYIWLEGVVTNLTGEPEVNGYIANYRDVTKRKELEERLNKAYTMARIGVWEIDLKNDTIFWSDLTKEIHETPHDYIPGLETGINFYKEGPGRDLIKRKVKEAIEEGKPWDVELQIITAKNNERWIRSIGETEFAGGKCIRVYGSFQDIDDKKRIEETIRQLNMELEEKILVRTAQLRKSNEELEAFSYSVSHDLRAPLRAIIGYTSILQEDYSSKLDEEAQRITGIIKRNTQHMGVLIDDLLAFSRLGKQELLKAGVNTLTLVNEVVKTVVHNEARNKNINWVIHNLPHVEADSSSFRQVWVNLISNAVKYSGNNPAPAIEIGFYEENKKVVFYVKDNGVGYNEKYKHKLFKVFQRLHSEQDFEGTGIGLAIVNKIISKHGGDVWSEAVVNKGATFYFSLPQSTVLN